MQVNTVEESNAAIIQLLVLSIQKLIGREREESMR